MPGKATGDLLTGKGSQNPERNGNGGILTAGELPLRGHRVVAALHQGARPGREVAVRLGAQCVRRDAVLGAAPHHERDDLRLPARARAHQPERESPA